jgi:hypothetical protein
MGLVFFFLQLVLSRTIHNEMMKCEQEFRSRMELRTTLCSSLFIFDEDDENNEIKILNLFRFSQFY